MAARTSVRPPQVCRTDVRADPCGVRPVSLVCPCGAARIRPAPDGSGRRRTECRPSYRYIGHIVILNIYSIDNINITILYFLAILIFFWLVICQRRHCLFIVMSIVNSVCFSVYVSSPVVQSVAVLQQHPGSQVCQGCWAGWPV